LNDIKDETQEFSNSLTSFVRRVEKKKGKYADNYLKLQELKAQKKAIDEFQKQRSGKQLC
jgi:predicted nuclease with TOPRIM domain